MSSYDAWKLASPDDLYCFDYGSDAEEEEHRVSLAPCPHCFESSGYMARIHSATWWEPSWADADPMRPCPVCHGSGEVESEPVTLDDLEEMDAEEEAAPESRP